jgi:pyruvate formate lyase activating enzyme
MKRMSAIPTPFNAQQPLIVGGVTPFSTIDYPGELSAVIFCQGCPWRCGYCQNGHLLRRRPLEPVQWHDILSFLEQRQGLLGAVIFSGGEPTLQRGLAAAIHQIRALGFKVGLHTAGAYPRRLADLLDWVDWVALDIKAPPALYDSLTGIPESGARAWQSARTIIASGIDHEFRTTVHPDILTLEALRQIVRELRALGAKRYRLQQCILEHCQAPMLRRAERSYDLSFVGELIEGTFEDFSVRL